MITTSKWILILFGIFILSAGFLMLLKPNQAREILKRAGSTNLINYGEITLRMIVAIALIIYSNSSKYPEIFNVVGWFMLITSLILYMVPRRSHHNFSLKCAEIIKPLYFQIISPFSIVIGGLIIFLVT